MHVLGFQDDAQRLKLDEDATKEKIKENQEKIKLNKQLPYLVGNVVEVWVFFLAACLLLKSLEAPIICDIFWGTIMSCIS